ncbi:MAG: (Fe-S)-binding protein [Chloroflexota bacterium]
MTIDEIVQQTKTYYCLECGKCTSLCPVARHDPSFSPRATIEGALLGFEDELVQNRTLFSCLTCYNCSQKCPADVDFPLFIRLARANAQDNGYHGIYAHAGQLQSLARLMTSPHIKQRRLEWLKETESTSDESDVVLWVGCAPYFEPIFEDVGFSALDITRATLKVLNHFGVRPKLLEDEKCCGHDALWSGNLDTFEKLARHNTEQVAQSGARKIIFSCPEGYRTLKLDYPAHGFKIDCELQHISEYLSDCLDSDGVNFKEISRSVTYQDPCRLGRHLGVYDAPRKVLQSIPGLKFAELAHDREDSICCGTSAFMNCDSYSNAIRTERLSEAAATNATTLVTCCPKCQTHFKCAMVDKGEEKRGTPDLEVMDLVTLVAEALEDKSDA